MNVKLTSDDRCAIDLILDHPDGGAVAAQDACPPSIDAQLNARVRKVERLFDLLGQMPASDPPAGLVRRTIKHARQHAAAAATTGAADPVPAPTLRAAPPQ